MQYYIESVVNSIYVMEQITCYGNSQTVWIITFSTWHWKCIINYRITKSLWKTITWTVRLHIFCMWNQVVVTTTELSPPPRWLDTTEPTPPSHVLQCSQQSFWTLVPENCPSLPQRHLIPKWTVNARWDQKISRRHCPPSPAHPLPHSQQGQSCAVSNQRIPGQAERSRSRNIHLFPINNPSLDMDRYSPLPPAPRWHVKKTPPPTELQIPATVTTLVESIIN